MKKYMIELAENKIVAFISGITYVFINGFPEIDKATIAIPWTILSYGFFGAVLTSLIEAFRKVNELSDKVDAEPFNRYHFIKIILRLFLAPCVSLLMSLIAEFIFKIDSKSGIMIIICVLSATFVDYLVSKSFMDKMFNIFDKKIKE